MDIAAWNFANSLQFANSSWYINTIFSWRHYEIIHYYDATDQETHVIYHTTTVWWATRFVQDCVADKWLIAMYFYK